MNNDNVDWPKVGINAKHLCFLQLAPTSLQDGVLSEREFKKFFECFLRYAFFDVVASSAGSG